MATIPTTPATVNDTGYISKGNSITINESMQAQNKNEPIFGVGQDRLQGYVALQLYVQHTASVVGGGGASGSYELFSGESYASGAPYVINESSWADNVLTV